MSGVCSHNFHGLRAPLLILSSNCVFGKYNTFCLKYYDSVRFYIFHRSIRRSAAAAAAASTDAGARRSAGSRARRRGSPASPSAARLHAAPVRAGAGHGAAGGLRAAAAGVRARPRPAARLEGPGAAATRPLGACHQVSATGGRWGRGE